MNHTLSMKTPNISRRDRVIVLTIMGVISFFMFAVAYTASAATLTRQLQLGASGSDVSDLQAFLARDVSVYPSGLVTGYYGALTQAAVSRFQAKNGIAVVGRVGPQTMAAINAQMGVSTGGGTGVLPTIGNVTVNTTNNGASLAWNTTQNTNATIYYGTTPIAWVEGNPITISSASSMMVNSDYTGSHVGNLTGLQPNTVYNYVVYTRDASGNENVTWPMTFTTQP